jgi:predicted PurR-regulated permease PerM
VVTSLICALIVCAVAGGFFVSQVLSQQERTANAIERNELMKQLEIQKLIREVLSTSHETQDTVEKAANAATSAAQQASEAVARLPQKAPK